MYLVTNRSVREDGRGLDMFGAVPSEKGPNELRLVKVTRSGRGYRTELLDDVLPAAEVRRLKRLHGLDIDPTATWYASLAVACEIAAQARKKKRHLLVYVHGYNNDLGDVLETARALERLYNVIVIPFSWPANGGGPVSGGAAYLTDKRDARASADALNRFVEKIADYHDMLTANRRAELRRDAEAACPQNPQLARETFAEMMHRDCRVTLNLLCHSMGNYLLKYAVLPGGTATRRLTFDNVSLVAADCNNQGHADWVEQIPARNRLAIFINEDDFALAWSRRKPGDAQLARLGHQLKGLNAENAYYIDVTEAPWVRNSHSYFIDKAVAKPEGLRKVFATAFEGGKPEATLRYHADVNAYAPR